MSCWLMPDAFSNASMAGTGPMPMMFGSQPTSSIRHHYHHHHHHHHQQQQQQQQHSNASTANSGPMPMNMTIWCFKIYHNTALQIAGILWMHCTSDACWHCIFPLVFKDSNVPTCKTDRFRISEAKLPDMLSMALLKIQIMNSWSPFISHHHLHNPHHLYHLHYLHPSSSWKHSCLITLFCDYVF